MDLRLPKLNLGCGPVHLDGFVNIDFDEDEKPDLVADVRHLPYEDGAVGVIYASHVLEHFGHEEPVLEEWFRVLAPGGVAVVIVPDLFATYLMRNRADTGWGENFKNPIDTAYINAVCYGGYLLGPPYDREGQVHHQIFLFDMLAERMRAVFPDAREVKRCDWTECSLGECMVMGTKPIVSPMAVRK